MTRDTVFAPLLSTLDEEELYELTLLDVANDF